MIDDETLFRWIDGELPAAEAARVEAAVSADPVLAGKAAAQRARRERLRAAFGPIVERPIPDPLIAAIRDARDAEAKIVDLAAVRAIRADLGSPIARGPVARRPRWTAIALVLVAGLAGVYLLAPPVDGPVLVRNGTVIAAPALARALGEQLASAGQSTGSYAVHLTFRDGDGAICRSFSSPESSGVACHHKNAWAIRALFAGGGDPGGTYGAAPVDDPQVAAYVGGIISGDPLDAAAERRARASGW